MILGGCEVRDEKHKQRLKLFLESAELRSGEVGAGQHVELGPCVPDHFLSYYEKSKQRPCPRVELEEENETAAQLALLLSQPQLIPLFQPLFEAGYGGDPPDERKAVVGRIASAIAAERARLFPKGK